jgi:hypothetical protein
MKILFGLVMLVLAACVLVGCHTTHTPVTQELVTGTYTFVSKDPESRETDHNLNHLVLQPDGKYDLVQGGTNKEISEKKGVWSLERGTPSDHVDVVLDHSSYPIEVKGNEVRLLIDLDTGVWWAKPR